MHPRMWTCLDRSGLKVQPGGFYVDPARVVSTAVVTHGHADHARAGHTTVVATPETHALMRARYGAKYCERAVELRLHESLTLGEVEITFYPAGHVMGSAQVQLNYRGSRLAVSGDYKRGGGDPTCADYEPVPCDVFLTEATFAYPLFRFPNPEWELERLLQSMLQFADRAHLLEVYSLGKAQRLIAMLRAAGWQHPLYAHGSILAINEVYENFGVDLGEVRPLAEFRQMENRERAALLLNPPHVQLPLQANPDGRMLYCSASGWNAVRKHARSRRVDLPLVVSDHCDWDELRQSIHATGASEVWVTHGPADSLREWAKESTDLRVLDLKEVWNA